MLIDRLKARITKGESQGGFTLIELLVVIVIIGILLAIAVPSYLQFRDRANGSAAEANLRAAVPAVETFFSDQGTYVGMDLATLQADYDAGLSDDITFGALTEATYCIQTTVGDQDRFLAGPGGEVAEGNCPA